MESIGGDGRWAMGLHAFRTPMLHDRDDTRAFPIAYRLSPK